MQETDASGNPILTDVGLQLRDELKKYFKNDADMKFIGEGVWGACRGEGVEQGRA